MGSSTTKKNTSPPPIQQSKGFAAKYETAKKELANPNSQTAKIETQVRQEESKGQIQVTSRASSGFATSGPVSATTGAVSSQSSGLASSGPVSATTGAVAAKPNLIQRADQFIEQKLGPKLSAASNSFGAAINVRYEAVKRAVTPTPRPTQTSGYGLSVGGTEAAALKKPRRGIYTTDVSGQPSEPLVASEGFAAKAKTAFGELKNPASDTFRIEQRVVNEQLRAPQSQIELPRNRLDQGGLFLEQKGRDLAAGKFGNFQVPAPAQSFLPTYPLAVGALALGKTTQGLSAPVQTIKGAALGTILTLENPVAAGKNTFNYAVKDPLGFSTDIGIGVVGGQVAGAGLSKGFSAARNTFYNPKVFANLNTESLVLANAKGFRAGSRIQGTVNVGKDTYLVQEGVGRVTGTPIKGAAKGMYQLDAAEGLQLVKLSKKGSAPIVKRYDGVGVGQLDDAKNFNSLVRNTERGTKTRSQVAALTKGDTVVVPRDIKNVPRSAGKFEFFDVDKLVAPKNVQSLTFEQAKVLKTFGAETVKKKTTPFAGYSEIINTKPLGGGVKATLLKGINRINPVEFGNYAKRFAFNKQPSFFSQRVNKFRIGKEASRLKPPTTSPKAPRAPAPSSRTFSALVKQQQKSLNKQAGRAAAAQQLVNLEKNAKNIAKAASAPKPITFSAAQQSAAFPLTLTQPKTLGEVGGFSGLSRQRQSNPYPFVAAPTQNKAPFLVEDAPAFSEGAYPKTSLRPPEQDTLTGVLPKVDTRTRNFFGSSEAMKPARAEFRTAPPQLITRIDTKLDEPSPPRPAPPRLLLDVVPKTTTKIPPLFTYNTFSFPQTFAPFRPASTGTFGGLFNRPRRGARARRSTRYTPSLFAVTFNVRAPARQVRTSGLTGSEIRPILTFFRRRKK